MRKFNQLTSRSHRVFSLWVALALLFLVQTALAQRKEVVFDNSVNRGGGQNWTSGWLEYGDELALGGVARVLTDFTFEYYAKFPTNVTRKARIRFYANDGSNKGPYWTDPGTLIYLSPDLTLSQGGSFILSLPGISVPDRFTWTVEFVGFANDINDHAGLPYYGGASNGSVVVGQSYRDFWIRSTNVTTNWSLQSTATGFSGNFAVKILAKVATNATPVITTNKLASGGGFQFQACVKPDRRYAIETAAGGVLGQWNRIMVVENVTNGVLTWQDKMDGPARFFRVRELSPVIAIEGRDPVVTAKAVPGVSYMLQFRSNISSGAWTALPGFVRTDSDYVTISDTSSKILSPRLYRILDANGK